MDTNTQEYIKKIETHNFTVYLDNYNEKSLLNKIKIINLKGIFVVGIPKSLNIDLLKEHNYLGQYGEIITIMKTVNKDKSANHKYYSVFVEFKDELSAALAIACNKDSNFRLDKSKNVQISYSTNKICKFKLLKNYCNSRKCYFHHDEITANNAIVKILNYNNNKIIEIFKQNACDNVMKNLNKLKKINNINSTSRDNNDTIFPCLRKFLVSLKQNIIPSLRVIEDFKEKHNSSTKNTLNKL